MIEQFLRESDATCFKNSSTQPNMVRSHTCAMSPARLSSCVVGVATIGPCSRGGNLSSPYDTLYIGRYSTTHGKEWTFSYTSNKHTKSFKSNCYFSSATLNTVCHMSNRVAQYQVADGGSVHVVNQSRENEDQRRRVGGTLVVSRLREPLEGREGNVVGIIYCRGSSGVLMHGVSFCTNIIHHVLNGLF